MGNFYKSYEGAFDLHIPNSRLGAPTSPMVAKQLEEFGKRLNEGVKNIEVGTISADKFEMIPKQHFDEIRRLGRLTDAHASVHAPLVDLAGFPTGEGERRWREEQRASTEQQVFSILERSHQLSNGENVPVVFHAGHTFSQEYGVPYDKEKHPEGLQKEEIVRDSEGKPIFDDEGHVKSELKPTIYRALAVVNQDSGEVTRVDYEEKYRLGKKEKEIWDPFKKLGSLNQNQWDEEKLKLLTHQKEIEDLKEKMEIKLKQNEALEKTKLKEDEGYGALYSSNELDVERMSRHIGEINRKLRSDYDHVYHKFLKFADKEEQKEYAGQMKELKENFDVKQKEFEAKETEAKELIQTLKETEDKSEKELLKKEYMIKKSEAAKIQLMQSKQVVTDIANMPTPEIWTPVKDFAIEQTAKTVSGAIAKMYEKLKKEGKEDMTPFIAMENFFVHSPMSRGEDLKKAVIKSRELLSEELKKRCNLSENDAVKEAEKLVGATWDVGHINNLRKAGYEGEELKEIVIKETKDVADVVKHVHITDNFGFFDSHLPPGMGNVPIREIMEQLEKRWAEQKEAGRLHQTPRGIVEAGGFVAEIGQNPQIGVLEYFGSPLYKLGAGDVGHYFGGNVEKSVGHTYSPYRESFIEFPQQHFNLYGSSFTTLPKTVGGQVSGDSSRFSGTPNQ